MKTIFLFRGLPGSGKSSASDALCDETFSTDDFFIGNDGVYRFDRARIKEAHDNCQSRVADAMRRRVEHIGVANTFTQEREMRYYTNLAERHGYRIIRLVIEGLDKGLTRNTHSVPQDVYEAMRARFEVWL